MMNKKRRNGRKAIVMVVGGRGGSSTGLVGLQVVLSFRPSGIEVQSRSYSRASLRSFSRSVRVRFGGVVRTLEIFQGVFNFHGV